MSLKRSSFKQPSGGYAKEICWHPWYWTVATAHLRNRINPKPDNHSLPHRLGSDAAGNSSAGANQPYAARHRSDQPEPGRQPRPQVDRNRHIADQHLLSQYEKIYFTISKVQDNIPLYRIRRDPTHHRNPLPEHPDGSHRHSSRQPSSASQPATSRTADPIRRHPNQPNLTAKTYPSNQPLRTSRQSLAISVRTR
jgi:hypothetical protein